ncbi:MAG: hypothetical protein Q8S84_06310 [bacterium]|nr:hypothetical protein [bacterium]MDP3381087.1 hypothetical protein [bacterium]
MLKVQLSIFFDNVSRIFSKIISLSRGNFTEFKSNIYLRFLTIVHFIIDLESSNLLVYSNHLLKISSISLIFTFFQ